VGIRQDKKYDENIQTNKRKNEKERREEEVLKTTKGSK